MNILIIGNGFDLAHKLPTQYTSFLNFIKFIKGFENFGGSVNDFLLGNDKYNHSELDTYVEKYINETIEADTNKNRKVFEVWEKKKSAEDKSDRIKHIEEMLQLSKDNIWFNWFQEQQNIHPDWVDFEAEISRVVQEVEKMIPHLPINASEIPRMSKKQLLINKYIFKGKATNKTLGAVGIDECKRNMLNDLNNLIRCFEIYLEDCVGNIDKKLLSPDIYDLKIDKLLSFNYTGTYERIYSFKNRNVEYDYIHGKSKIDSASENNMVLGIDEYLKGEDKLTNTDFIEFKKYYQRLKKKTGCVYKKWIEEINHSKENVTHNVYIFGHSLAMTDKDVLMEFITNEKTKITIFYCFETQYSAQIINLVHMLGPDKLNAMVYGTNPKIVFKHQAEMIDITDSEWEVVNDRNKLWNIYNLHDNKIRELLTKIKEKLKASDTTYFHDQKNVISMYNALVMNCDTDFNLYNDFIEVARLLFKDVIYDENDWVIPDYRGNWYCDRRTANFINEVNKLNYEFNSEKNHSLCVDKPEILFNELKGLKPNQISKEKATELFVGLFELFKSQDSDCNMIWKCIYKLHDLCTEVDWRSFINGKMENAKKIDKIRLHRFFEVIDEQEYYDDIEKQQENYENEYEL